VKLTSIYFFASFIQLSGGWLTAAINLEREIKKMMPDATVTDDFFRRIF
jgi:hypothetical protein